MDSVEKIVPQTQVAEAKRPKKSSGMKRPKKLTKGSAATKRWMAHLRSMRKGAGKRLKTPAARRRRKSPSKSRKSPARRSRKSPVRKASVKKAVKAVKKDMKKAVKDMKKAVKAVKKSSRKSSPKRK